MSTSYLLCHDDDGVRTVTIDRPEARNALTIEMRNELAELLRSADRDSSVRVLVLTGTDPAFCAGVDLKELQRRRVEGAEGRYAADIGTVIREIRKPTLAAVNGPCVTGGLEVALSCDLLLASQRATFADTHASFGMLPAWGLSALLPHAVGSRMALDMSLTGRFVEADEALHTGIATRIVPHEELLSTAEAIARSIANLEPRLVASILELNRKASDQGLTSALATEREVYDSWAAAEEL